MRARRAPPRSGTLGTSQPAGSLKRRLAIVVLVAAAGCARASTARQDPPPARSAVPTTTDAEAGEQAALVNDVRSAYTQADVDFMTGMIHHHAQALVMSRMAPSHGAGPALRIMADRIVNAQNDEIALMQRWLRDRGEPVPDPESAGHGDHDAHGAHAMMPGMLTSEQLGALDAARGEEFERLFLQFMIQHHQGAVTMVNELVGVAGAAREESVFRLASDIGADQSSEITRMQTMLRDLLFSSDEAP